MALSNWDTLAFDHEAKPVNGIFESPCGVIVEIYKNWLYVSDPKAWEEKIGWSKPVIMKMDHGVCHYKDVQIVAIRGPQIGVYAAVWSGYQYKGSTIKGMIGCGVSGFDDNGKWIGVTNESILWFQNEMISGVMEKYILGEHYQDEMWEFTHEIPEVLRWSLLVGNPLRFNQGDAFFAKALGNEISATAPDKANTPMLTELLERMK